MFASVRSVAPACRRVHGGLLLRAARLAAVLAALPLAAPVAAAEDVATETVAIAGLTATVWYPASKSDAPRPLIVFSHGFTGCATQAPFLTRALAEAGYIVAAPEHRDSSCTADGAGTPEAPFGKPSVWTEETYRQRGRDIAQLIAGLEASPIWAKRIDATRIGLMGHSLGGYIALGLGGALPSWRLGGVKGVLAMAPLMGPLLAKGKLEDVTVPVMYQVGERDRGTTTLVEKRGGAFDKTRTAYLVEFRGADHFAWAGSDASRNSVIAAYAVAFFATTLEGKAFRPPAAAGTASLRIKRSGEARQ